LPYLTFLEPANERVLMENILKLNVSGGYQTAASKFTDYVLQPNTTSGLVKLTQIEN
jgi:hypothetical protein